jgi:hypothetical protein
VIPRKFVPDTCDSRAWNPIAASGHWAPLAAVLAGFVFAGMVVVLTNSPDKKHEAEASHALRLLLVAFFGLVVTSYLLSTLTGEQVCGRAETEGALVAGTLATSAIVMIVALTWLMVAYGTDKLGIVHFLHGLVYFAIVFVVVLLNVSSTGYVATMLPATSHRVLNLSIYASGTAILLVGGTSIFLRRKINLDEKQRRPRVRLFAIGALSYLAITAATDGFVIATPWRMWYPARQWIVYGSLWLAWTLPLAVLVLAARAMAPAIPLPPNLKPKGLSMFRSFAGRSTRGK